VVARKARKRAKLKNITISTDVYAAIWGERKPGEETETAILRRVLKVKPDVVPGAPDEMVEPPSIGFREPRYRVTLPHGFEITRQISGKEYRARAIGNKWVLQGSGNQFSSLNELSGGVGIDKENAWENWFFVDEDGVRKKLSAKRDPGTIIKRSRKHAA
jgi:hypothetical protein